MEYNFDDIRCYNDQDIPAKLWPLAERPEIEGFIRAGFPDIDMADIRERILTSHTIHEFQHRVVIYLLNKLSEMTTTRGLEGEGLENVDFKEGHVFITNHRDIVLDSAYLCTVLDNAGDYPAKIAIGNNLFAAPWIEDLCRVNGSFVVRRDLTGRQMLESSMKLSAYIRKEINEEGHNVWIAQREGRSKDNSDHTQSSVIKMLAMGGESRDLIQNIRSLRAIPVSISYEYDPCDYLKAAEFQLKRDNPDWKKSKADDVRSMVTGIRGYKGRVVFRFSKQLNEVFDSFPWINDKTAQVNCVCQTIDRALHAGMELYPINYYAYDIRFGTDKYKDHYTQEEAAKASDYLNGQLAKIDIPNRDESFLWQMLLTMYSNPVVNAEALEREPEEPLKPLTD